MLITNDDVEGVPILMLANKQDVTGAMQVEDVKEVFNRIASKLGARDSRVMTISALRGYRFLPFLIWPLVLIILLVMVYEKRSNGCIFESRVILKIDYQCMNKYTIQLSWTP